MTFSAVIMQLSSCTAFTLEENELRTGESKFAREVLSSERDRVHSSGMMMFSHVTFYLNVFSETLLKDEFALLIRLLLSSLSLSFSPRYTETHTHPWANMFDPRANSRPTSRHLSFPRRGEGRVLANRVHIIDWLYRWNVHIRAFSHRHIHSFLYRKGKSAMCLWEGMNESFSILFPPFSFTHFNLKHLDLTCIYNLNI